MTVPSLDIAFFGSSLVSAYWNGAATYYRGIIRALHQRGHRITFYEPDAFKRQSHRDIPDPPWANVVVYSGEDEGSVFQVLEAAGKADLVIKASGVGVFDELLEREVLQLRRRANLVAFWDVDAPATLERLRRNPHDPFLPLVPKYDFVFTYGGGEPVVRAYQAHGARYCVPIYNALDRTTHYRVAPDFRYEADTGFLGNRLPDREHRVEEFFLSCARRLPHKRFLLGGNGWADKPMTANVKYVGHVYTADHNAFNSTPLTVLNINRESMAFYGYSPPTRIFEAAGAAACIISDRWSGLEDFLEPGKEVLVAENGAEVAEYLSDLTLSTAQTLGRAAYRRIVAEHTYQHRVSQFEAALGITNGRTAYE